MLGLVSLTGALDWQALETVRRMIERRPNFYRVFAIKQRGVGGSGHRLSPHRGCTSGRGADAKSLWMDDFSSIFEVVEFEN